MASQLGVFVVVEQFLNGGDIGAKIEVHIQGIRSAIEGERILVHGVAVSCIVKELLDRVELVESHFDVRPLVLFLADDPDRLLGE
jgi:hypothetical protein